MCRREARRGTNSPVLSLLISESCAKSEVEAVGMRAARVFHRIPCYSPAFDDKLRILGINSMIPWLFLKTPLFFPLLFGKSARAPLGKLVAERIRVSNGRFDQGPLPTDYTNCETALGATARLKRRSQERRAILPINYLVGWFGIPAPATVRDFRNAMMSSVSCDFRIPA